MTLAGSTTAGLGVLVLFVGFAFTLTGGAIKRWGGAFLLSFIAGPVGMALGGNTPLPFGNGCAFTLESPPANSWCFGQLLDFAPALHAPRDRECLAARCLRSTS